MISSGEDNSNEQKNENDYVQPIDFTVGKEVNLLGHKFLIRDCDSRTRKYYEEILKVQQSERVAIDQIRPVKLKTVSFLCLLNLSKFINSSLLLWF